MLIGPFHSVNIKRIYDSDDDIFVDVIFCFDRLIFFFASFAVKYFRICAPNRLCDFYAQSRSFPFYCKLFLLYRLKVPTLNINSDLFNYFTKMVIKMAKYYLVFFFRFANYEIEICGDFNKKYLFKL